MRLFRPLAAAAALLLGFGSASIAQTSGQEVILKQDADYRGFDLRVERDVTLDQCEEACLGDNECRAFTYNMSAQWCFLKNDYQELVPFQGAIAGRVVETAAEPDIGAAPDLAFVPQEMRYQAQSLRSRIDEMATRPTLRDVDDLFASALAEADQGRPGNGISNLDIAVALSPDDPQLWARAADLLNGWGGTGGGDTALRRQATLYALNGYQITRTATARADALAVMARALEQQREYKLAIASYEESLRVQGDPDIAAALEQLRREKGFRVTGHEIEADAAAPRVCLDFSDDLSRTADYEQYVTSDVAGGTAVSAEKRRLCVEGLRHGGRFRIVARAGLPSAEGGSLYEDVAIEGYVRDRSPAVRFTGDDFIVARSARQAIPIVGVSADAAELELYRIGDRGLTDLVRGYDFLRQLSGYSASDIEERTGEKVWSGTVDLEKEANREAVTSIPLADLLPEAQPGIYVLTAKASGGAANDWDDVATQWFLVSDIGISTFAGDDGLTVFAASLDTAQPLEGTELSLLARNNEVLASVTTDAEGRARFAPGAMRGKGGLSPTVVTARQPIDGGTDFVFLDIDRAGFDLSDRGVAGRATSGPVDVYSYLDRGIYRAGETVHGVSLVRDVEAAAMDDLPLTAIFRRPDGVEAHRRVLTDARLGAYAVDYDLPSTAMRGTWRYTLHTDPDAAPVAETLFLVEDFTPDRIEFDLSTPADAISPDAPAEIDVDGRFLYGAPAAGLALEGDIRVKAVSEIDGFPGYSFGLADEESIGSVRETLSVPATDEGGQVSFQAFLPSVPATTKPLAADIFVRMVETGGRAVERNLTIPVAQDTTRIGIRPEFTDGHVDEGSVASFQVIAIDEDGQRIAMSGLDWTLYRIERNYHWYRQDSAWRYEPVEIPRLVDNGTVDALADGEVRIRHGVEWGRYRLEVASPDAGGPISSVEFDAGWFVETSSTETPDALEIALDADSYAPGETARLHIAPRFGGKALIAIGTRSLSESFWADVPAEGADIDIPVSADWGGGAYVTATLLQPGAEQENRLPMRAIGTTWLTVDPGEKALDVSIDAPDRIEPGRVLEVPIEVSGLGAGEEAFVTVAAVDVGILNLTRYEAPDPEDWYFGQKALALELRDLYGRIIDSSPGVAGRVRSGGDGPGLAMQGRPPTDDLLSLFSGVVRVDVESRATVTFDIPQFNGTARIMAVAWSRKGVGQASRDVVIRAPVVLSASMPKAVAPGDVFAATLELHNTDGPAGTYDLAISHGDIVTIGSWQDSVDLDSGARRQLAVEVTAQTPGRAEFTFEARREGELIASASETMAVRPASQPQSQTVEFELAADTGSVRIDRELLEGQYLEGSTATINLSRYKAMDVAGLLMRLANYPYGCAEQTTSRALPLLYLSDLGATPELVERFKPVERVDEAIDRLLTFQTASGGFGLWGPYGGGDLWLDAYVTDFLTRAREKGHSVPEQAMQAAVQNLQNSLAYNNDIENNGSSIAYSLYVLARNRMASASDLRYFADVKLDEFRTPLARAQLAAALALYNEGQRTISSFSSAVRLASATSSVTQIREDYGSGLRDRAAMLALAAESGAGNAQVGRMVDLVEDAVAARRWTSTQEDAWLVLAARSIEEADRDLRTEVDGEARTGPVNIQLTGEKLALDPVTLRNLSGEDLTAVVTTRAAPKEPPRPSASGFEIERRYFGLDGKEVTLQTVDRNERLLVVLKVTQNSAQPAHLLLTDLLPGGLEIDNPSLVASADLENFDWLPDISVAHTEFRDDRFVAGFDGEAGGTYTLAYLVRAVTPGIFTQPAAAVEDMYRPELNARTATGFVEVLPGS